MGLGTNDSRVLSSLALYPGASATEVSEVAGLNKAVISKSVTVLVSRGLVVLPTARAARGRFTSPTPAS